MPMEDTESCSSRSSPTHGRKSSSQQQHYKPGVYTEVLRRLCDSNCHDTTDTSFEDELWSHFNRLPARYAIDVNVERADDVLVHKRLLRLAQDSASRPVFDVRLVQVPPGHDANSCHSLSHDKQGEENTQSTSNYFSRHRNHPPPAFGSATNLDALALDASSSQSKGGGHVGTAGSQVLRPMHEITFAADDRPKLLSQLTSLLAEVGLNIQEAHVFSTNDGYSLDVFVVEGWPFEETEQLRFAVQKEVDKLEKQGSLRSSSWFLMMEGQQVKMKGPQVKKEDEDVQMADYVQIPTDENDVWELDLRLLKFENKVASGSYGDLYRGTYCSQDVAIKVLKPERLDADMQKEFAQEVYIMRKVRHKNVVQFIGACTRPPSLCIVTEYMSGGSVYDFLHKQKGVFKLPALLRVASDVSKGMNYLHQSNIIHRDLKAANLLMDENEVVKVGDFGVARVKAQSGVMTAETGTYRWMSPEVIEHKPYDHKADVFSFGIVLWELLTGKLPYECLTPLQAAVGVVQQGLRPTIPRTTHPKLANLLERCWQQDPTLRPDFSEILQILQQIAEEVAEESEHCRKSSGGFFSVFKRGH